MILPTPELLTAVLGIEFRTGPHAHNIVFLPSKSLLKWQELYIENNNWDTKANSINIYELMHLMIEWALTESYIVSPHLRGYCKGKAIAYLHHDDYTSEFTENVIDTYITDSMPEAVTQACLWILATKT